MKKKHLNFYSIMGIIADIILWPVLIIALLSSVAMFVGRRDNAVPKFFNYSLACVLTQSMKDAGFTQSMNKKDFVILKSVDVKSLRSKGALNSDGTIEEGSIIAFYYYKDSADYTLLSSKSNLTLISDFENVPETTGVAPSNRQSIKEITSDSKKIDVYFHRVVGVYQDESGVRFFETQGDNNAFPDSILIREDFVIGRYVNTPIWLRDVLRFCSSQTGMILLVVLPLGLLIFFQCLSVIEQVSNMRIEKRVLKREIPYNSPESVKANIGVDMENVEKINFYATSPQNERQEVADFLWGYLENKKSQKEFLDVRNSLILFEKNPNQYWGFWNTRIIKKRDNMKLQKYWGEWKVLNSEKKTKRQSVKA